MRHLVRARWISGFLLLPLLSVPIGGCGGDDGPNGDGNGDGDDAGILFTASNVKEVARIACGGLEIFPRLSGTILAMIQAVEPRAGRESRGPAPASLHDLGDLGLCATGESNLSWDDVDGDQAPSGGDVLTLAMVDCDGELNGTIALLLHEAAYALTAADATLDLTIGEVVDGVPQAESLTGAFRVEVNRVPGPPERAIFRYVVVQTDGASRVQLVRNGETAYAMGCFNLYYIFEPASGAFTLSEPLAVFRIPGLGVMSMQSWGSPPLVFANGAYPESGEAKFYAYSTATPCAGLDIGGQGVDSNDSVFRLTATGGGGVSLAGTTDEGSSFTVNTAWTELAD